MSVSITIDAQIACVLIDNPPVNATSHRVRQCLNDAITSVEENPDIHAVILMCAGRTFVAGDLALEMVAGGKPISAAKAMDAGLVDRVTTDNLKGAAISFSAELALSEAPVATQNRRVQTPARQDVFDTKASAIVKKARGQNSPQAAIEAVRNALTLPAKTALEQERRIFLSLKSDPQSKALRHIFFAERASGRVECIKGVSPHDLNQIGVIGGGTMGAGIAATCLLAGFQVIMIERDIDAALRGQKRVFGILDGYLKRGLLSDSKHATVLGSFQTNTDYGDLVDADMVIEAVFEDMAVKTEVFQKLQAATRPDAVLATNTSYLDINQLAASLDDPSRVIGLHFFSPAHIMKLLEIIKTDVVADDVLATGIALAKRLGKTAVLAGVYDGFIANRIMSAYRRECEYMLEDGALPWETDRVMTAFGLPMGMFQMQDLAGLEISWAMRKRQAATRATSQRNVSIADTLCEMGRLGRKTGKGWYNYASGSAVPDLEVTDLVLSESSRKGIGRFDIPDHEIMSRILLAMQTEGQAVLSEGIARSADDIDVAMVNAFGFPRWWGGPMYQKHLENNAEQARKADR